MVDLHSHTTASDGQHSPSDLIRLASAAGVSHLAITDHDTVSGLAEGLTAAKALGLTLIPGIELSAFVGDREIHILGHFIRIDSPELSQLSIAFRGERHQRMEGMSRKLNALGVPMTMDQVLSVAGDAHLGRPHLARALVERGVCSSTKNAFDRFLGNDRPGFVDRQRISGERAIAMVREAGGAATVAKPASRNERSSSTSTCETAGWATVAAPPASRTMPMARSPLILWRSTNPGRPLPRNRSNAFLVLEQMPRSTSARARCGRPRWASPATDNT